MSGSGARVRVRMLAISQAGSNHGELTGAVDQTL